jgi:hypothetical protein
MKLRSVFALEWKSFFRFPLWEQAITLRLVIGLWKFSLLYILYVLGSVITLFESEYFLKLIHPLIFFALLAACGFVIDLPLKYILKKSHFKFKSFYRFPQSKNCINYYLIIKELYSVWNLYLLVFLFPFLRNQIYPVRGMGMTIILFLFLYAVQLCISLWINKLKENEIYSFNRIYFWGQKIEMENSIGNYILLNIRMTMRSPRIKKQMLLFIVLSGLYIYLFHHLDVESFIMRLFLISMIFLMLPLGLNQFLFSAEAAFFDQLMMLPRFRQILQAKYLFYLFFSLILFGILLFTESPFNWGTALELLAIFCYCSGTITLASFCGILFVNTKIDLFNTQSKMTALPITTQSLASLLIYGIFFAFVCMISILFSGKIAVYFMLFMGVISSLYYKSWFNYLYQCFYPNKYEKMEFFRIQ